MKISSFCGLSIIIAPYSSDGSACRWGLPPLAVAGGRPLDAFGDHRAACATSGALRTRAVPVERTLARILREAGARVHMHVPLAHMNLDPPPADGRAIEILAQGLPLWHGNLRLTQPLLAPLAGMARHTPMLPPPPQPPSPRLRGANASRSTLSLHPNAAAVLSLWGWKSAGAGALRPSPLSTASPRPRREPPPWPPSGRGWRLHTPLGSSFELHSPAGLQREPAGATLGRHRPHRRRPSPFFSISSPKREETTPPHPSRLPLRQGI